MLKHFSKMAFPQNLRDKDVVKEHSRLLDPAFIKKVEQTVALVEKAALGQTKTALVNLAVCFKRALLPADSITLSKLLDDVDYCVVNLKYIRSVRFVGKTPDGYYFALQAALDLQELLQTKMRSSVIKNEVCLRAAALNFPLKSPNWKPDFSEPSFSLVRACSYVDAFSLKRFKALSFLSDVYSAACQSFYVGSTEYQQLFLIPSSVAGLFYWADFYNTGLPEKFIAEQVALHHKDPANYVLPFTNLKEFTNSTLTSDRAISFDEVIMPASLTTSETNDLVGLASTLVNSKGNPVSLKSILLLFK